jgi:hypothetical protein
VVSERLGHANIGITLDCYSHCLPALSEEAAYLVAALVVPDLGVARRTSGMYRKRTRGIDPHGAH